MRNTIKIIALFVTVILAALGCSKDDPVAVTGGNYIVNVGICIENFTNDTNNINLVTLIKTEVESLGNYNVLTISDGLLRVANEGAINFDDLDSFAVINRLEYVVYIVKCNGLDNKAHYSTWCMKRHFMSADFNEKYYWTDTFDSLQAGDSLVTVGIVEAIIGQNTTATYPRPDQFLAYEQSPYVIKAVPPTYPNTTDDGKVITYLLIDSTGYVASACIAQPDSNYLFNEATLRAVKQFIFSPAMAPGGIPTMCWVMYPITFRHGK
jgi:TonB family protein